VAIVDYFIGNALNAVDAKGRVSLPAGYRSTIERRQKRASPEGGDAETEKAVTFLVHPKRPSLLGFDNSIASMMVESRDRRKDPAAEEDIFSLNDSDRLAMPGSWTVGYDGSGRMVLPGFLRAKAGITDLAYFFSAQRTFEMWAPDAFLRERDPALAPAQEQLAYLLDERARAEAQPERDR
jgi:MraZ protein